MFLLAATFGRISDNGCFHLCSTVGHAGIAAFQEEFSVRKKFFFLQGPIASCVRDAAIIYGIDGLQCFHLIPTGFNLRCYCWSGSGMSRWYGILYSCLCFEKTFWCNPGLRQPPVELCSSIGPSEDLSGLRIGVYWQHFKVKSMR